MHKKSTMFRKFLAALTTFGLVATGVVFLAPAVNASPIDSSTAGLEFIHSDDVLKDAVVGDSFLYSNIMTGVNASVTVTRLVHSKGDVLNTITTEKIDDHKSDATKNKWMNSEVERSDNAVAGEKTVVEFRISFLDAANNQAVTLTNVRVNAYDLDNSQSFEVDNVDSYQVSTDTPSIVNERANLGNGRYRFSGEAVNASTCTRDQANPNCLPGEVPHSQGEGRVQINFVPTSSITLTLLFAGDGSLDFDFTRTGTLYGLPWLNNLGQSITAPAASSASVERQVQSPVDNGAGSSSPAAPTVTLVSPLATVNVPNNRNVSLFGTNFDKVTEVFVGGRKLTILKQTANQIDIRLPSGFSGLVDLELKSTLNNVLSTKHFNYGGLAATATRKAELIVGGFAHNSRVLTPRMKNRIDRWLERNSDLGTLTCTGFTSLPRRTTDVALSTNRGKTACSYSESQRSEIESSVSQGIEDPRPGSNVRRVRLVLTQ